MTRYLYLFLFSLFFSFGSAAFGQTAEYRHIHAGNRYFRAHDYKNAEASYLRAVKADPKSSRARLNLGDTYLAQNNTDEALKQFEAAAKSEQAKDVRAMAYHNIGYVHHKKQELDKAIENYKQALRLNPHDEDTRYNLALAQRQKKQQDQQNKDQNKDQQKQDQQKQHQDKQNQDQNQQKQDQNQQQNQNQQQQPQQQQGMSDQNVEQLLNLSRQAEEQTRRRIDQAQQPRRKQLPKNW